MSKDYTKLEQKILDKGKKEFTSRLEELSKPIAKLFREYKLQHKSPLFEKITFKLDYGYSLERNNETAVDYIKNGDLDIINEVILDKFLKEFESIKEITDEL